MLGVFGEATYALSPSQGRRCHGGGGLVVAVEGGGGDSHASLNFNQVRWEDG